MMPAIRTDGSTRRARRRLRAALPLLLPLLLAACAGGSSQSVTAPKPCMPPMSWIPFTAP